MNYYYGPPPPQRRESWLPWIATAIVAVFVTAIGVIVMATTIGHSGSAHFTSAETKFLGSVKSSSAEGNQPWVSWPDDAELVSEGHAACVALADAGGNRERIVGVTIIGEPMMPAFMKRYPYNQRAELVNAAAESLCTEYATWIGGLPI